MRHLLDSGRHPEVATIAIALGGYWFTRYLGTEAQRWLGEALTGDLDSDLRMKALAAAGWAAYLTADYLQAEARYEECLALARATHDRQREAEALYGLARIHLPRWERDGGTLLLAALSIFDEVGAELQAAECRLWLGLRAANAGQVEDSTRWLNESTEVLEQSGHRGLVSVGYRYLSLAAWYSDDEATARRQLELAESIARTANDHRALAGACIQRGLVEGRWGDVGVAAQAILDAMAPLPDNSNIDYCLVSFGAFPTLIRTGRWDLAARLLAHLDRTYDEYGWTPLEARMPAAAEFRAAIAEGSGGERLVDDQAASTADMMTALADGLAEIAHAG